MIGLLCPLCKRGTLSFLVQNGIGNTKLGVFGAAKCAECKEEMQVGFHPALGHVLENYFVRHNVARWQAFFHALFPRHRRQSKQNSK